MSITPRAIQDLLNELEASRASRKRAWEVLQEIRWVLAAAKEGRCVDEGWRVRKDGSQFWASVVVTALKTQTGALRGFLKITRLCASPLIP